jgi:glycosyltransferase involved in cell wall biosynthesis
MIVGEGEERNSLKSLAQELGIEEDVALPGFVDNPYPYMARSALFALSSGWEGLGLVLIEAMACGTPVVSTDCPSGPREILEDGRWGRLVPVGSVEGLAQAMLEALEDPGRDPRTRAGCFSVGEAVEEYLQLLWPESQ